jgi:hypothetical protein
MVQLTCNQLMTLLSIYRGTNKDGVTFNTNDADIPNLNKLGLIDCGIITKKGDNFLNSIFDKKIDDIENKNQIYSMPVNIRSFIASLSNNTHLPSNKLSNIEIKDLVSEYTTLSMTFVEDNGNKSIIDLKVIGATARTQSWQNI